MSDTTKTVETATEKPVETIETKTTFTLDDVKSMVNEQVELVKTEWMKRFDQKNTETVKLKKELESIERAKLSEKERIELERQDLENAIKQKESELQYKQLSFEKSITIAEMKLDKEYIDVINGDNIEVFKKNIELINKKINDEVERRVNDKLGNSVKPQGNTNNNVSMQDEVARLTKEGKLAEAIALQNKIYNMSMK